MTPPLRRLPRTVRLFRHIIRVDLVPGEDLGPRCKGQWDSDALRIYIRETLSLREQWATLAHELWHAVVDLTDWEMNREKARWEGKP